MNLLRLGMAKRLILLPISRSASTVGAASELSNRSEEADETRTMDRLNKFLERAPKLSRSATRHRALASERVMLNRAFFARFRLCSGKSCSLASRGN